MTTHPAPAAVVLSPGHESETKFVMRAARLCGIEADDVTERIETNLRMLVRHIYGAGVRDGMAEPEIMALVVKNESGGEPHTSENIK